MISHVLVILIGMSAIINVGVSRYAILCFYFLCSSMILIDSFITVEYFSYYYLMSAFIDLLIIVLLSNISKPNNKVLILQKACMFFIYFNFLGWIMYESYMQPFLYDSLCAALFAAILFISVNTRKDDVLGDSTIHCDSDLIFGNSYAGTFNLQNNKEAQRSCGILFKAQYKKLLKTQR